MPKACAQTFTSGGPAANITIISMPNRANSGPTSQTFSYGEVVQPAWHIILPGYPVEDLDLQPPWPTLKAAETIATWVPPAYTPRVTTPRVTASPTFQMSATSTLDLYGTQAPITSSVAPSKGCQRTDHPLSCPDGSFYFIVIGIPIIGLLLVSAGIWRCCYIAKKKRERGIIMVQQRAEREIEMGNSTAHLAPPVYGKEAIETGMETPPPYAPRANNN